MFQQRNRCSNCVPQFNKSVNIPIELYESLKGDYFIGYADNLSLGKGKSAWARLYNPCNSGVNLFVNVWTATSDAPFQGEFWFNTNQPCRYTESNLITPSNSVTCPPPYPRVRLQSASNVWKEPEGGVKAFIRNGEPGTTLVETENGKLIFPPGGSFLVYITLTENVYASGRIAFGWWEQKINSCRNY